MDQTIVFTKMKNRSKNGYVTWGAPWLKGQVEADAGFILQDESQGNIPVQSRITAYWPDGSVKWTAHSADGKKMSETVTVKAIKSPQIPCEENHESGIQINENNTQIIIQGGHVNAVIPKKGNNILEQVIINGRECVSSGKLISILEERSEKEGCFIRKEIPYIGEIQEVQVEEQGLLKSVIKITGIHKNNHSGREVFPFILRLTFYYNDENIHITHTFLYDGDEKKDFLKGMGIRFYCPIQGELYNRNIRFAGDHGYFAESLKMLLSWRPRIPEYIYEAQLKGEAIYLDSHQDAATIKAIKDIPNWDSYHISQDTSTHFSIKKSTGQAECCQIESLHGLRTTGTAAFAGEKGGVMLAMKDFWQKYPSAIDLEHLTKSEVEATVWIWSPQAEAMDFRHYDTKGYSQTYYEGFDEVGATPYGIANTNEIQICGFQGQIPDHIKLKEFEERVQKPCVLIASPKHYHDSKVFGHFSLPKKDTPAKQWLEDQMDSIIDFYKKEIDVRKWYGLFDYGDVMHTYDKKRHCWRYDMGGYAWQNTELVPTFWLWYSFLRSGREDIFTLAEAMSRHCSEVDTYHLGQYKGIGSRHNVRHWGCSCKEARIAMAGHHRFYYYMMGDHRLGDVFEDVKDGDHALLEMDPLRFFYDKEKMVYPTHARSGPDWSSFCSNWLTQWESKKDSIYKEKIKTGIEVLKKSPLQLISGSDYEYDPATSKLRYIGENAAGGSHLSICMGSPQTWFELSNLLEDEEWTKMIADYGRFYYMPREKQLELSKGLIGNREFSLPYMAASMAAFGAAYYQDKELGTKTWKILIEALTKEYGQEGFQIQKIANTSNQEMLEEIPWISTNFVSQWCLNVIVALDLIEDDLPIEIKQMD